MDPVHKYMYSIDSDNVLAPSRQQVITWTNDEQGWWRIYALLSLNELRHVPWYETDKFPGGLAIFNDFLIVLFQWVYLSLIHCNPDSFCNNWL